MVYVYDDDMLQEHTLQMGDHMFRKQKDKETNANMKGFPAILFRIYLSIYLFPSCNHKT